MRLTFVVFLLAVAAASLKAESIIDMLILVDQAMEDYHGGRDGVVAHSRLMVASANMGFENSKIDIRLRLQGVETIDYQASSTDMGVDLEYITNSKEIGEMRNRFGADLVSFVRPGIPDNVIGVAWKLTDPAGESERGFSVVSSNASLGTTFQHEIGHNLGGAHNRVDSKGQGLYPYSHGYKFSGSYKSYKTIMAYGPEGDINYFSNPRILYEGVAIGVESGETAADNARTFNQSGPVVAAYREHVHIPPVAEAGGDRKTEDLDGDGFARVGLSGADLGFEGAAEYWDWTWLGGSASGQSVTVDLPVGEHEITLTVTDSEGFQDEDTLIVRVYEQSPIVSFDAGGQHSLFVKSHGSIWGAGQSHRGQLGFDSDTSPNALRLLPLENAAIVSANQLHTLVVRDDGSLWAFGGNDYGQLGDGTFVDRYTPVRILDSGVANVSAGLRHSIFLMQDGAVWTAGSNTRGQLGDGTFERRATPVKIFDKGVQAVAAGSNRSVFLMDDGSVYGAGEGFGDNPENGASDPVLLIPSGARSISADQHILIVMQDGSLWAMGLNYNGVFGGEAPLSQNAPVKILDAGVRSASAGMIRSLIVMEDGSLMEMGLSAFGYAEGNSLVPRKVINSGVVSVSTGSLHCLVLRADGSIWSIGVNDYGQLGTDVDGSIMGQVFMPLVEGSNTSPVANAGPSLSIPNPLGHTLTQVSLNGSGSTDDWQVRSWHWSWWDDSLN